MDVLALSRLQFAVTIMFHFLFVPLTLGLSWLVAWWEMRYVRTGDATYLRMAKFWGKLFLINFALGIVTGITMEFQFGMNWAEYSRFVGDIFGAPLAIEATVAFFLESTLIGLWIFGWNKISKKAHALTIALVAFAANLSALWIILANAWQQHPVGYALRNGRAEMTDFKALIGNPYGWNMFTHTVLSGFVCAGFFVMGVSAYHLLRKNQTDLFRKSFRTGRRLRPGGVASGRTDRRLQRRPGGPLPAGQARGDGVALGDRNRRALHRPGLARREEREKRLRAPEDPQGPELDGVPQGQGRGQGIEGFPRQMKGRPYGPSS